MSPNGGPSQIYRGSSHADMFITLVFSFFISLVRVWWFSSLSGDSCHALCYARDEPRWTRAKLRSVSDAFRELVSCYTYSPAPAVAHHRLHTMSLICNIFFATSRWVSTDIPLTSSSRALRSRHKCLITWNSQDCFILFYQHSFFIQGAQRYYVCVCVFF